MSLEAALRAEEREKELLRMITPEMIEQMIQVRLRRFWRAIYPRLSSLSLKRLRLWYEMRIPKHSRAYGIRGKGSLGESQSYPGEVWHRGKRTEIDRGAGGEISARIYQ